jgi:chemotaxis protein histidine kinase CheA
VHLIRNAVDHGLEGPEERTGAAKSVRGRLTLSAAREGQAIVLRFSDDGRGIQWQHLAQEAVRFGMPFETEEQRMQVLFHDGVTTTDVVTEISGRGLGMPAVREQVGRRGGTIKVMSQAQRGTTIELRIPVAAPPAARATAVSSETLAAS